MNSAFDPTICDVSDKVSKPFPAIAYYQQYGVRLIAHAQVDVRFQALVFHHNFHRLLVRSDSTDKIARFDYLAVAFSLFWHGISLPFVDVVCKNPGLILRCWHECIRSSKAIYLLALFLLENAFRNFGSHDRQTMFDKDVSCDSGAYSASNNIIGYDDYRSFLFHTQRTWVENYPSCNIHLLRRIVL